MIVVNNHKTIFTNYSTCYLFHYHLRLPQSRLQEKSLNQYENTILRHNIRCRYDTYLKHVDEDISIIFLRGVVGVLYKFTITVRLE